jgi:hypothetical protein
MWRDEKEFTSGQTIHHHKYHVLSAFTTFAAFAAFATFAHSTLSEETKDETHEALRGATGSGNVTLGQSATGTTTLNGTTSVGTLNSPSVSTAMTIGNNLTTGSMTIGSSLTTGNVSIASGTGLTTGAIAIGAGSTVRGGVINIGTGGTGGIAIGNTTCNTNLYNVYLDGATLRAPRLIAKSTTVITVVASGNYALTSITSPTGNNFDLICHVWNGDAGVQQNMVLSASVNSTTLFAMITNATAGSARISYAVYAP